MEAEFQAALVARAVAVAHDGCPELAGGAIFRDFFEEVVMCVEKEAEAGREIVNRETSFESPVGVFEAVAKGEGEFLERGGSGFTDVVSANRKGIKARGMS